MSFIYFKEKEIIGLEKHLVEMLDNAREYAGIPFIINSGRRDEGTNEKAGGVCDSAHCKGLAVDLRAPTSDTRFLIVSSLLQAGFTRIGIAPHFVHCDIDRTKPQEVIFIEQ
jgi:zinc D-Ala-D-Ala carboxypeptidase